MASRSLSLCLSLSYRKSSSQSRASQNNALHSVAIEAAYLDHCYIDMSSSTRGQGLVGLPGSGGGLLWYSQCHLWKGDQKRIPDHWNTCYFLWEMWTARPIASYSLKISPSIRRAALGILFHVPSSPHPQRCQQSFGWFGFPLRSLKRFQIWLGNTQHFIYVLARLPCYYLTVLLLLNKWELIEITTGVAGFP